MHLRRHRIDRDVDRSPGISRPIRDRVLVPIPGAERAPAAGAAIPVVVGCRLPARRAAVIGESDSSADPAPADSAERCLARPPRLNRRRTGRLAAAGGTTQDTDGAARAPGAAPRGLVRIGHLNAQSITNKLDDITILLRDQQLDILCLSETWLWPQISDQLLAFPGYCILRRDRDSRRGGGVAILHRSEMQVQRMQMPADGPLETLWVSVSWSGGRPTTVGVVYRPPDSPETSSLERLQEQLQAARCHGRPVFLLGDVNLNVLDTAAPRIRRYLSMIGELSMAQLVDRPTHLHPVPTALDHVLTDQRDPAPRLKSWLTP